MTLDPQDLGTIDLRLRVDAQNQVHLLITTESDATRELLQQRMAELREALARQEMGFGEVIVQVGDQQSDNQAATRWGFAGQQSEQGGDAGRGMSPVPQEQPAGLGAEPGRSVISVDGGMHIIV
ncbi:MAG: flagellar hook-length control protein FliK [Magnetococcus sp. DMHC-8]